MSGAVAPAATMDEALDQLRARFSADGFCAREEGRDAEGCDFAFSTNSTPRERHARFSSSDLEQKIQVLERRTELSHILDLASCTVSDSLEFVCRDLGRPSQETLDHQLKIEGLKKGDVRGALDRLKDCVEKLAPQSSMAEDVEVAASELLMNAFNHSKPGARTPSLCLEKTPWGNVLLSVRNDPGVFSRKSLLGRWKELSNESTRAPHPASKDGSGAGVGLYSLLGRVSHLGFAELSDGTMEVSVVVPVSKRQVVRAHGHVSLSFVNVVRW
jgi:anti-sigma regulatory factor (Ser/Thr protein kinase)